MEVSQAEQLEVLYIAEGSLLVPRGEGKRHRLPGDAVTVGVDISEDLARELLEKQKGQGTRLSAEMPKLTAPEPRPPVHETDPLVEDLQVRLEAQQAQINTLERQVESLKAAAAAAAADAADDTTDDAADDATKGAIALAHERGVDLTEVEGTGADGRITKADVERYLE